MLRHKVLQCCLKEAPEIMLRKAERKCPLESAVLSWSDWVVITKLPPISVVYFYKGEGIRCKDFSDIRGESYSPTTRLYSGMKAFKKALEKGSLGLPQWLRQAAIPGSCRIRWLNSSGLSAK